MRTPNDVSNIMHERFEGLDFSFYDALAGKDPVLQGKIYDILDEMGGIDIDGVPGKENRETYASPENAYLLKQAIMKDKTIVADFLTENIVADNWKEGEKERADGTPKWQIPGTPEWERVRKANEESNLNQTKRLYKDIYYGAGENKVQGQILDNLYSMLDGAWRNGQDQSEMPGDDILKALQKQAGSYDLMLDPNFKQFSGATTSGAYTMPKDQELTVAKLWNNAKSDADGSSEKYAVSTLNTTFGSGFTQEDAGNKWAIGYGGRTYNLKNSADKDLLLKAIKAQKVIDNS